jgi:hypothetical protein
MAGRADPGDPPRAGPENTATNRQCPTHDRSHVNKHKCNLTPRKVSGKLDQEGQLSLL